MDFIGTPGGMLSVYFGNAYRSRLPEGIKMLNHIERVFSQVLLYKSRRIQSTAFLPFVHVLAVGEGHTRFITSQMSSKTEWTKDAEKHLVWVDMEMTDLDVTAGSILEVACIITDSNLNVIAEGPDLVIHQPDNVLQSMNEWCITHHGMSGLTEASRKSMISIEQAEQQILDFLKMYIPPGSCPVAGNSVYMDRLFMQRYLPQVDKYLHYRIIDISSVKELCRRWCPRTYAKIPPKIRSHRSLSDIKDSIEELQYYRFSFFKTEQQGTVGVE